MKFNIPQDFDIKKLLNNLDLPFESSEYDMKSHAKATTVFCFAKHFKPSLSIYTYIVVTISN
jgi:hypothetical protein